MEELRTLTHGLKTVVDAYLAGYRPTQAFNIESCILVDTKSMILEMESMCHFDEITLADYLTSLGYRAHFEKEDSLSGWILEESQP